MKISGTGTLPTKKTPQIAAILRVSSNPRYAGRSIYVSGMRFIEVSEGNFDARDEKVYSILPFRHTLPDRQSLAPPYPRWSTIKTADP